MADFLNKRTLLIGGAVLVGGLVIVAVTRGGSSGTVTYTPAGVSPAQAQANAQLAMAGIAANTRVNEIQAQLAANTQDNQARLALAGLAAQVQKYEIDARDAANTRASANDLKLAEFQTNIARYTIDAQVNMQALNNNFQLDYAQLAANTSTQIAAQQAETMRNILDSQNARDLARITSMRDISLAEISADVRARELRSADNVNRMAFLNSNLPLLRRSNRDDILRLVAGGDPSHAIVPTDLQGIGSIIQGLGSIF
jgi:hypothetical protein